jgi:cation transport ATPase
MAFSQKRTLDTLYIKTSALCQDCKQRIESTLNYQKGVKYAELDLETKIATVIFKRKKNNASALRQALSKVGYDADELKADPNAVLLLPKCCQPGGH